MITVIHRETVKARKEYYDDGWEFVKEWLDDHGSLGPKKLTFAELRTLGKYRMEELKGSKILKGQFYERQFNSYDGQTYTWRMKKDLYDIACKYDLFPDVD